MRRIGIFLLIGFCLGIFTAFEARAQLSTEFAITPKAHTQVKLFLSDETARPGDTVWVGVQMDMDDEWHTYWKNPGISGEPTQITWQLPPGITAGEIQWPLSQKLSVGGIAFYGYEHEVVLLVPLKLADDLIPGPQTLTAQLTWLECKEQCIPGATTNEITLNIGDETKSSADAATIESWKSKTPKSGESLSARAWWDTPADGKLRSLVIELTAPTNAPVDFFPDAYDSFDVQAETKIFPDNNGHVRLLKSVKSFPAIGQMK